MQADPKVAGPGTRRGSGSCQGSSGVWYQDLASIHAVFVLSSQDPIDQATLYILR